MFNYGIGGTEVKGDASEAFADIPQNRTLMIEKLTDNDPIKPEIVMGLQTIEQVFDQFKPEKEVEFVNEHGASSKETLRFGGLQDFGVKGITNQSAFLNGLNNQKEQYDKFTKQIKTNKVLMGVLNDAGQRQDFLNALNAMIQEMEDAK
jgi:hypothetical protein